MDVNQDELTLLRRVRDDVDQPSTAAVNAGRAALLDAAAPTAAKPVRRHRGLKRAGWTGLGIAVAGGIAAILVLTNVIGLGGWRGGADPCRRRHPCAGGARHDQDGGPSRRRQASTSRSRPSPSTPRDLGLEAPCRSSLSDKDGQLYIPADRNNDWVWVRVPSAGPEHCSGPASDDQAASIDRDERRRRDPRAKGGFFNGPAFSMDWGLDAAASESVASLNYIYRATPGGYVPPDAEPLVSSRIPCGPVSCRPTFERRFIAHSPGSLAYPSRTATHARWPTGVAFGSGRAHGLRQEIIIDPSTGPDDRRTEDRVAALSSLPG